jgi:predicted GIY-YIG superfamily endonuclease
LNAPAQQFWVNILENERGRFYVGQTDDLPRRLTEHHKAGSTHGKFTLKHGPWVLVWSEVHRSRASAIQRKQQIKRMKSARWIRDHLLNR